MTGARSKSQQQPAEPTRVNRQAMSSLRRAFQGKVAVITGAGSGIGRETASQFASGGATVVLVDSNEEAVNATAAEFAALDHSCLPLVTRVDRETDVTAAAAAVSESFGGADILVNCAGILRWGSLLTQTQDDWDLVMNVNLKGTWLMSKAFVPLMGQRGGGSIVNIGSNAGLVGMTDMVAYAVSKGGVVQLTRAMAMDAAPLNIRVNCICPGHTNTRQGDSAAAKFGLDVPTFRKQIVSQFPIGRLGEPEDIARAILFLASDDASFITGAILSVDGGYTAR